jgi:DNA-binding XRE family transcriptional regulator
MITMAQQKLVLYRIDAGFRTQQELADAAGVSVSIISFAETGARRLSLKSKQLIINALRARGIEVTIGDIDWEPQS